MNRVTFLRYPGGKQRLLSHFIHLLPPAQQIKSRYVEPFLGGGAIFFCIRPNLAYLADINQELIDLYKGVQNFPNEVWEIYKQYPSDKDGYYEVRELASESLSLIERAARTLFLNRTCFKGMWRHNAEGKFNVGYGGQERRWVISLPNLLEVSNLLQNCTINCSDFEHIVDSCSQGDFIFLDPPYKPGKRTIRENHYRHAKFTFDDQVRLCNVLQRATERGVRWAQTNSSHQDIMDLYTNNSIHKLPIGTGAYIGHLTSTSGEMLICNYGDI